MKTTFVLLIVCLMMGFNQGCQKEKEYILSSNLSIIPENPGTEDEIQIVEKDASSCETLSIALTAGNNIEYTRRFNSMLAMPCLIYTDTVSLGHLEAGNYKLLYTLIDKAYQTNDSIVERSIFSFDVSEK